VNAEQLVDRSRDEARAKGEKAGIGQIHL
jgi:hypothetical protein